LTQIFILNLCVGLRFLVVHYSLFLPVNQKALNMMKVKKSVIPAGSKMGNYRPVNYWDAFVCEVTSPVTFTPDDVMTDG